MIEPPSSPARGADSGPLVFGLLAAGLLGGLLGVSLLASGAVLGAARPEVGLLRAVGLATLLAGIGLVVAGVGVVVFAPVARGPAAAAHGFGGHRVMLLTTLFTVLLAALLSNTATLVALWAGGGRDVHTLTGFLTAALCVSATLLGVAYLRFVRPGVVPVERFGLGHNRWAGRLFGQTWLAHLVSGLAGGLLVLVLSGVVQLLLQQGGVQQTQLRDIAWVRGLSPPGFALILGVGALLAPLSEEIFFRGIIFDGYYRRLGATTAYLLSSAVFASLHLNLPAFLPILVLGAVLAWLYRSTGSLVPCILAHGLNNGVAFLVLYLGPRSLGLQ